MKKIEFQLIENSCAKTIEINAIVNCGCRDENHLLKFKFNRKFNKISDTSIAIALSTLCGREYEEIYYHFSVDVDALVAIGKFTKAKVDCANRIVSPTTNQKLNPCLLFSGGMDSLACKALLPKETVLISNDFGGKFSREREFYKYFDPVIMESNITETPFRKNSWSFMGLAAILMAEKLDLKTYTFGGILASNIRNNIASSISSFPPFAACGMEAVPSVIGLTEVGTALLCLRYQSDHFIESIESVANKGEEKFYRKRILANILLEKENSTIELFDFDVKSHFSFGQNLTLDFLSFYIVKHLGAEFTNKYIRDIPEDIIEASNNMKLSFYERFNPDYYNNMKDELRSVVLQNLLKYEILPYESSDWNEFHIVRGLLSKYHNIS